MRRRRAYKRPAARRRKRRFLFILGTIWIVLLLAYVAQRHAGKVPHPSGPGVEAVRSALLEVAARHGMAGGAIPQQGGWLLISLPPDQSLVEVSAEMVRHAQELGASVELAEQPRGKGRSRLVVRVGAGHLLRFELVTAPPDEKRGPQIALVLDDFGYSAGELVQDFLELPWDMTVSVIPGLPFSGEVAQRAAAAGKEVMVHMPMEALHEPVEDHGYTLFVTLSDNEVRERVARAIASVPGAVGLNNHQGSRATADAHVMIALMEELKARGLYFVDSRTNSKSIALEVALRLHVPCAANAMFLDVEPDTAKVRQQLRRLAQVARRQGKAVGIGHVRRSTYELLRWEVPRLQHEGFQFVPVSKLLELRRPPIASGRKETVPV